MMYSQRLTSDNISLLLIMTMTLTQMGTVPRKTDPVGGSIDAVLPISMHLIIRTLSFHFRPNWSKMNLWTKLERFFRRKHLHKMKESDKYDHGILWATWKDRFTAFHKTEIWIQPYDMEARDRLIFVINGLSRVYRSRIK